jgi:hypothetical protein
MKKKMWHASAGKLSIYKKYQIIKINIAQSRNTADKGQTDDIQTDSTQMSDYWIFS